MSQSSLTSTDYKWGSGFFRDIADHRRRVYTSYFVNVELRALIEPIVGEGCRTFLAQVLDEIENPRFFIDSKRYEEIAAYLWNRCRAKYGRVIAAWENEIHRRCLDHAPRLLDALGPRLSAEFLGTRGGVRRAVLTAGWASLGESVSEEFDTALVREGQPEGINVPIDFADTLAAEVFHRPGRIVVLPGDVANVAGDLQLYGQALLETWLTGRARDQGIGDLGRAPATGRQPGVKITFLANEHLAPRNNNLLRLLNPTVQDLHQLLELPSFALLRSFRDAGLFEIRSFRSHFPGTVLTDLDDDAAALLAGAEHIVATGEPNNLTLNGLVTPCFRIAPIRDFAHVFFTGLKWDRESFKYPRFSILYTPGVHAALDTEPDRPTILAAKQYFDLHRALPAAKWRALVEAEPRGGNILAAALRSAALTTAEREAVAEIRGPSLRQRIARARALLAPFGGTYTRLSQPVNRLRRRVVHLLRFPPSGAGTGEPLRLGVRFAQSLASYQDRPKTLLTFDDLCAAESGACFGFNFLYFITRNLRDYFNQSNPHFILGPWFFGQAIDFLQARIAGRRVLHPPLFHKGAIGIRPDGSFVFGRVRLPDRGAITVPLGRAGPARRLVWEAVNPPVLSPGSGVAVFTPMAAHCSDPQHQAPHVAGETRSMSFVPDAVDRYHFVMINDRLLGVVRGGRTEIPPFGTVLSVPEAVLSADERALLDADALVPGLDPAKRVVDGQTRVEWDFALDPCWAGTVWSMGGALLMVDDGRIEELRHAEIGRADSVYRREGWALESSQRTQETPVETELREARTTIGLTADGQFFLAVIEGRANNRQGATHLETVEVLQSCFRARGTEVRYALDLDSASSVALAVAVQGKFWLLNQTARGSDSKLGDTRFFNHLAFLSHERPDAPR